jgi:hypothetical protein
MLLNDGSTFLLSIEGTPESWIAYSDLKDTNEASKPS